MLTAGDVRKLKERVKDYKAPILSLYAELEPANRAALSPRLKSTLADLDVPQNVQRKVVDNLSARSLNGRTLAVFCDGEDVDVVELQAELPVVDARTGQFEAHYGEPYLAPLVMALEQTERYAVVSIDQDRWRLFEVFLGEIQEVDEAFREVAPGEWDRLKQSKQVHPAYVPSRGGAARDNADRNVLEWMHRFHRRVADQLENTQRDRGIDRVILSGPSEATSYFEASLPQAIASRITARVPGLSTPGAPASEVLARASEVIETLEGERQRELVERVLERGVRGLAETLEALQQGRVQTWIVPWRAEDPIFIGEDTGAAAATEQAALAGAAQSGSVRRVSLRAAAPGLAERFGARVEFLQGAARERLLAEGGGAGGLLRW